MSWNVDVFNVGVQQVRGFAAQNFYPGGIGGIGMLDEGVYLVVECCTHFGRVSTPWVHYCFQKKQQAINYVLYQDSVQNDPDLMDEHDQVIGYEVWHVVDDAELWGDWAARVLDAKIDAQRKADACRISLDNGHTFLDPVRDDADLEDLIDILDAQPQIWDLIVPYYMDDDTREFTHLTSDYTGMLPDENTSTAMIRACWLCDYLKNADSDLIY